MHLREHNLPKHIRTRQRNVNEIKVPSEAPADTSCILFFFTDENATFLYKGRCMFCPLCEKLCVLIFEKVEPTCSAPTTLAMNNSVGIQFLGEGE